MMPNKIPSDTQVNGNKSENLKAKRSFAGAFTLERFGINIAHKKRDLHIDE